MGERREIAVGGAVEAERGGVVGRTEEAGADLLEGQRFPFARRASGG